MDKEEIRQKYFDSLVDAYKFAKGHYLTWFGLAITISAAILGFSASKLLETPLVYKWPAYLSFCISVIAVVYGLFGMKKRIERELNTSSGAINELVGKKLSDLQKRAMTQSQRQEGKPDNFSEKLIFLIGCSLFFIALSLYPLLDIDRLSKGTPSGLEQFPERSDPDIVVSPLGNHSKRPLDAQGASPELSHVEDQPAPSPQSKAAPAKQPNQK